jgi:hypothetical protein
MRRRWLGAFTLLAVLLYGWAAGGTSRIRATREPEDFYGFLTDAFLSGQTHLKVAPDPALQNLANPWAGAQGIPRLHDASYFHGRYYLYFGPAPVVLLLLPWRLLTGTFLSQATATALFGLAGTVLAGGLLLWAWQRWFLRLGKTWLVLGLLAMLMASRALVLVEDASVYQVPITCAFFCLMLALGSATWALTRGGRKAAALGLGGASVAWGLAVASRPDYLFSVGALAVPLCQLGRRARGDPGERLRLAAFALAPVALIGIALAAYNYTRFGDVLQFGMKYQFTAGDQRFLAFFSPESLGENLRRYFFSRPRYITYFPFLVSGENWGLLFCTPLAVLAAAWPLTLAGQDRSRLPGWGPWGLTLAAALGPNVLFLCLLAIANERYFLDFVPLALLLGIVSAWALLSRPRPAHRFRGALARAVVFALAAWTIGQGLLMAWHNYSASDDLRPLARTLDRAVAAIEERRGIRQGPMVLEVRFPIRAPGTREAVLVSGHGNDVLYVEYPAPGKIRFGFFHAGSGGPLGAPVAVEPGRPYRLKIDSGSLYPPTEHPLLASWPEPLAEVLRHRLDVSLDGQPVLQGAVAFYPTDPGDIRIGENPGGLYAPAGFSGAWTVRARGGVPSPASLQGPPGHGPVRLVVRLPPFESFRHDPLISTGHRAAGDLLYVAYVGPGLIRLGEDSWGSGGIETAPLAYDPDQDQVIDADLGSLRPTTERGDATLALRLNGRLVMFTRRPFNASPPAEVVFGFNGCDSSTAGATFEGSIVRVERIAPIPAPPPVTGAAGPIQLVLRLPEDHAGLTQPLLASGGERAGLVLVRYLDHHRVALGYAQGSSPPRMSAPIATDYGAAHAIEISFGSLYPAAQSPAWAGLPERRQAEALETLRLQWDGQPVLWAIAPTLPEEARAVFPGRNPLGLSYCEPAFTGALLLLQRLPIDAVLPPDIQVGIGPVRLSLRFPADRPGRNEPLLVTGRPGAGDALYVHYIDGRHLSVGYDHWNAGGPLGAPLELDYAATHVLDLSLGSLYPAAGSPAWGQISPARERELLQSVSVVLDGKPALRVSQTAYPATAPEIHAATNPIGLSTSDATFTGEIAEEKRVGPAP